MSSGQDTPRQVECPAAAAEGENDRNPKPLGPLVGFPLSDDAAEGGSELRAEELAAHNVVAAAFDKGDVFGWV